jgi:hypothetical protein
LWVGLDSKSKFHLVILIRFVLLFILEGWGSGVCLLSIRLYWESGYGGVLWREAFSRRVVDIRCGNLTGDWCTNVIFGPYGVNLWKYIRWDWDAFSSLVRVEMGDGS